MSDGSNKLIRNSTAERLIFTSQAGEPHSVQDVLPTSEKPL